MRRLKSTPAAAINRPASAISPAGKPVCGSSPALVPAVEVPLVDVGAAVAEGVVDVGVAAAGAVVCFFVDFFGVLGADSGSWYCSSPAPSANAVAGDAARAATTSSVVARFRGTRHW